MPWIWLWVHVATLCVQLSSMCSNARHVIEGMLPSSECSLQFSIWVSIWFQLAHNENSDLKNLTSSLFPAGLWEYSFLMWPYLLVPLQRWSPLLKGEQESYQGRSSSNLLYLCPRWSRGSQRYCEIDLSTGHFYRGTESSLHWCTVKYLSKSYIWVAKTHVVMSVIKLFHLASWLLSTARGDDDICIVS